MNLSSVLRSTSAQNVAKAAALFVIAILIFSFVQSAPTLADPDSFYHAKITALIRDNGILHQFPWLSATTLQYRFVDHHLLYHVILIPFVTLFSNPLVGVKVASIFFAALFIAALYLFLKRFEIAGAWWYALFLVFINPFIFRLNLAKAPSISLILMLVVLYALFTRKYMLLLLTCAAYVWFYGGWPLGPILACGYAILSLLLPGGHRKAFARFKRQRKVFKSSLLMIISAATGALFGLIFSPYFPVNIYFYREQIYEIALVNYKNIIGVGGEWYAYLPQDLFGDAPLVFILLGAALVIFAINLRRSTVHSWFLFILAVLFFALTLKSRRYVEYFIPLAVLFSAFAINSGARKFLKTKSSSVTRYALMVGPLLLLTVSPLLVRDVMSVKSSYDMGFSYDKFQDVSQWIANNSESGEVVVHSDWDEFPFLFYHNASNFYVVGLDPTFMYRYSPRLHEAWVSVVNGTEREGMHNIIANHLNASYVVVHREQNKNFYSNLQSNFNFINEFDGQEASVFRVLK